MTANNLAILLFAFAAGLMASSITITAWAQQGVNVTTPDQGTQEVPTLADAIQNNIQSLTALVAAIIALIGLIVKTGILDTWISRKKQEQFVLDAQMNFVTMKKALEDKVLNKFILDQLAQELPEEKRKEVIEVSMNLNSQINKTAEQLEFYYERLKGKVGQSTMNKINPDLNIELPRETHNITNDMGPIPNKIGDKVST